MPFIHLIFLTFVCCYYSPATLVVHAVALSKESTTLSSTETFPTKTITRSLLSTINQNGYSFTSDSYNLKYNLKRPSPPSIIEGIINWERLSQNNNDNSDSNNSNSMMFSPRHSHATCIFKCPTNSDSNNDNDDKPHQKNCIWLIGGRTEPYRTYNLQTEDRTADIWYSRNGKAWTKVMNIYGDYTTIPQYIGNYDAKEGNDVAPFYSRYGHTLNSIDVDGDGINDIMVLMGGFSPRPSNDIWISEDGLSWFWEGNAKWSERAYHATVVFGRRLWVMGGTPLNNEVWSGFVVRDESKRCGYRIWWSLKSGADKTPWAPRCAMCVLTQTRKATYNILTKNSNITTVIDIQPKEVLYLIGGYAGWPRNDSQLRYNGERTRNDVWISENGIEWNLVLPSHNRSTMPFVGRGWHSCTTWHHTLHKQRSVKLLSHDDELAYDKGSKMFIAGGGYMGTKGNSEVRVLEGYLDMWWSYDGSHWERVNYEEGYVDNESLYSTNEWTSVLMYDNKYVFRGKWGHSLISFPIQEDINLDGVVSNKSVSLEFCAGTQLNVGQCKMYSVDEENIPSLFIIGGDTTDGGPIVNDVFRSRPGVICERNGVLCSGNGSCGPATIGCVCDSDQHQGEYCEITKDVVYTNNDGGKPMHHQIDMATLSSLFFTIYLLI